MARRGSLGTVVALLVVALAAPATAQQRPLVPPVSVSSARMATRGAPSGRIGVGSGRATPLGRTALPAKRTNIIIPGQPTPDKNRRIIVPGQTRPGGPVPRILRPGAQQPDPNRRLIVPGQADPDGPEPVVVAVDGSSIAAMARTLRSVGEHRLAASLCRQTGGCSNSGSPRTLNPATRRGGVPIRLPVKTDRLIYTARNRTARNEDTDDERMPRIERIHSRSDPLAQRAYDKAGVILSFYRTVLGRNSFDDRGSPLRFVIHYGQDHDNASWSSAEESDIGQAFAAFGDGDEHSLPQMEGDMPYHEVTHGVVDTTSRFEYEGESGALHEHFADALAETAQQWEEGLSVGEASWEFGDGTFRIGAEQGALRSFAHPEQFGQPSHMSQMGTVNRNEDHGGVHDLSGIPNRAFYGAATRLGGHTWEHVGVIWYAALRDFLGTRATFADTARATVRAASELFGNGSREARAVRAGWADVGLRVPLYRGPPASLAPSAERRYGTPLRPEPAPLPERVNGSR